jgi:RNA polymerase sigma-70 factor (ECF subfamily)
MSAGVPCGGGSGGRDACSVRITTFRAHADPRRVNDTAAATEEELLAGLRRGDEGAFATIFRLHFPGLVRNATQLLREGALGEEIAQEVMLELWRRREGLLITGALATYLHQATRNRALNRLRHERTVQRSEPYVRPPSSSPGTDDRAISAELRGAIARALSALSAPQREVFELSRSRGLTYLEIADLLGISVKTVEARMGRALRELRERLAPWIER